MDVRTNILLPDPSCQKSELPGQLRFFALFPEGRYLDSEQSNRFSPGEGVSGRAFFGNYPVAEGGRHGVSEEKFNLMPPSLQYVACFPLIVDRDAFGVVSIDFIMQKPIQKTREAALRAFCAYRPVLDVIAEIADLLSYRRHEAFMLTIRTDLNAESAPESTVMKAGS